jgi:hypothetical protein
MKTNALRLLGFGVMIAGTMAIKGADPTNAGLIHDYGLPSGSAYEALPQNAIIHLEFQNVYQTLLNFEQLSQSLIPAKAAPPQIQGLLQSDHPLLTILGAQTIQEPLTEENLTKKFGVNPSLPVTATLYLGDPKKSFILSIPVAEPEVLSAMITNLLQPSACEIVSLGDKTAVRLALNSPVIPELYLVCSKDRAYFCGDRAQVLALQNTPSAERLSKDAFMKQASAKVGKQDVSLIFNPSLIKPFLLQLQQLGPLLVPLLHAQREHLLKQIPDQARPNLNMQLQNYLGVRDLEQFGDYAEGFIVATYETVTDALAAQMIAFEGLGLAAKLDPAFPQLTLFVFSRQFQPDKSANAIPMDEVRKAAAWLGKDFQHFTVSGHLPQQTPSAFPINWTKKVQSQLKTRNLDSVFIDNLETLLEKQVVIQPLESKAPWTLTTDASLQPLPSPRDFKQLESYFQAFFASLSYAAPQPVTVVPGQAPGFLESWLKEEAQALNTNDKLGREFNQRIWHQTPFYDRVSRLRAEDLGNQIKRFDFENVYTTHSGLFGYDQHELINRRIYLAREVDGYLVSHRGNGNPMWLTHFPERAHKELTPALAKILDRVPSGANFISVHRGLQQLPAFAQWLNDLENLAHTDLDTYLAEATKIQQDTQNPEQANVKLKNLKMPGLVYSLNRETASGKLYCLLPGNLVYPRDKVTPVLVELLADYAAKADQSGGCLVYTRVQPEAYEISAMQSTEGIACLITNVGNSIAERYLGDPEKMSQLQKRFVTQRDQDPERFEEIIVRNPRWEFLPGPKLQRLAQPTQAIPERDSQADAKLLDLSAQYNGALTESWQVGGLANNDLAALPRGIQEFGGVKFDVRGVIQLSGREALTQLQVRFPKEVKNIKVGQTCQTLHFLQATAWAAPEGTTVGSYLVHYANGESREIPIVYGRDVRDWWTQGNEAASAELKTVWTGKNEAQGGEQAPKRLFESTWKNPRPDIKIESLDYRSAMSPSAPFLIAITVE